jgi:outer membrane immunogenic protein
MKNAGVCLTMLKFFFLATAAIAGEPSAGIQAVTVSSGNQWTGFFFGGSIGYANTAGDFSAQWNGIDNTSGFYNEQKTDFGGFVGGQFGYDWQVQNFVVGLSVELKSIFSGSNSVSFEYSYPPTPGQGHNDLISYAEAPLKELSYSIDGLASFPLKVGFLVSDTTLLYATGGISFASASVSSNGGASSDSSETLQGYNIGLGAATFVAQNTMFFIEGKFHQFEETSMKTSTVSGPYQEFSVEPNLWTVGAGLNYRF